LRKYKIASANFQTSDGCNSKTIHFHELYEHKVHFLMNVKRTVPDFKSNALFVTLLPL